MNPSTASMKSRLPTHVIIQRFLKAERIRRPFRAKRRADVRLSSREVPQATKRGCPKMYQKTTTNHSYSSTFKAPPNEKAAAYWQSLGEQPQDPTFADPTIYFRCINKSDSEQDVWSCTQKACVIKNPATMDVQIYIPNDFRSAAPLQPQILGGYESWRQHALPYAVGSLVKLACFA